MTGEGSGDGDGHADADGDVADHISGAEGSALSAMTVAMVMVKMVAMAGRSNPGPLMLWRKNLL